MFMVKRETDGHMPRRLIDVIGADPWPGLGAIVSVI
jgi:hypothetical protein